ncbi:Testis-expressed sequence 10 protein [Mycena sanguinolenta]|uniref:Pre-rRNA-processing protein n=1 Tax=Mycena sanguinolenta TaxID=230812 RepID=A0A8H7CKD7_9AGAR|nr:Testis-expressed sequence 10 protein [Mycena sanguinolenta]
MPKSAKKRKDKAADFSKAKLKLGKGKQLASNAIDTSFKARSIALPSQSITVEKDVDAPTTKRRLTFDDLVSHLKHYNAGTRKDAIIGFRELLDAHPAVLESSLTTLINATARLVGDEDATVRKALLEFFVWLFPRIPTEDLVPHATAFLLFTTSAQTHIFPEIRVDAIRFLNLYLEYIPAAVVAGWNQSGSDNGSRVLEGYLGILSAGTKFGETDGPMKATSTASVVAHSLFSKSKLVVFQSLSTFLRHAVSSRRTPPDQSTPSCIDTWYLASWFKTHEAYTVFDRLLHPRQTEKSPPRRTWQAEADLQFDGDTPCSYPLLRSIGSIWTLEQLSEILDGTDNSTSGGHGSAFVRHLARTLHSTLISTFLDCAPSVFSPNGSVDETQAKLIVAGAEITSHLYSAILRSEKDADQRSTTCADLKSILNYMAPYFPFKLNGSREIKAEQIFQALNLIFCELTSMLVLTSDSTPHPRGKNPLTQGDTKDSLQLHSKRVSDHVVQLLKGESLSTSQLGRPLTSTTYSALLPTVWALINANPNHRTASGEVLRATIEHATQVSSKSALKQITIEFVARLVLLRTEPQFNGHLDVDSDTAQLVTEWINHLPRCLWELGSTNLAATEIILRFLIILHQRRARLPNPQTVWSLRAQIVPYFSITHATRGKISGPYSKVPSGIQRLALDLAALIGDDAALSPAVQATVLGTDDEFYWRNIHS